MNYTSSMIFFSYFFNAKVRDSVGDVVGNVKDALIRVDSNTEFPLLLALTLDVDHKRCIVTDAIESWGPGGVILDRKLGESLIECVIDSSTVSLKKTIVDRQIVDLAGMRVVRVNDVQFGRVRGMMSLIALDISTRGLLRRIGMFETRLDRWMKPNFIQWKQVSLVDNKIHLSGNVDQMVKLHPADIANLIEKMNIRQGSVVLESLDQATAARVLEEVQPDIKTILVKSLGPERAAAIMGKMSIDELVDLIQLLPSSESREIIHRLPANAKTQNIKSILEYDEDTAGGLMTTELVVVHPQQSVADVIEKIKDISQDHHTIPFVYVVDEQGRFCGILSTRRLLVSQHSERMEEIMKSVDRLPTAKERDGLMDVAELMTKYNLFTIAVLDEQEKLLGVVTADDIMRRLIPHA